MTESKKNLGGRPSIYTPEIAKEICDKISVSNKSLQSLCLENPHWPGYSTIWEWIGDNRAGIADQYAKAKEKQADHLCESILTIIDKPETFVENGVERNDTQMIRIKVDALKWQAMKLKPKKYADKHAEDIYADHERVKRELEEVRAKLDSENTREY